MQRVIVSKHLIASVFKQRAEGTIQQENKSIEVKISYKDPTTRKLVYKAFQVTKIFFLEPLNYFLVSEQKAI